MSDACLRITAESAEPNRNLRILSALRGKMLFIRGAASGTKDLSETALSNDIDEPRYATGAQL
jgi:hypothetical protein